VDAAVADVPFVDAGADVTRPTPYYDAVLADAPIAWYRFEETSGAMAKNSAPDSSVGSAGYSDAGLGRTGAFPNEPGYAVEVSGGKISVSDGHLAFPGTAKFTLEAWVYPKTIDGLYRRIISHEAPTTVRDGYLLYVQNGAVGVDRWLDGGVQEAELAGTLLLGIWSHVVATFDGSVLAFYLNGQNVAQSNVTVSIATVNVPFTMGTDSRSSTDYFVGGLDEIAVYDKALSATRVAAHYSAAMEK